MRIITFAVILYACLSLFAPRLKPVASFEAAGILFYWPWDALAGWLGGGAGDGSVHAPSPAAVAPSRKSAIKDRWWEWLARLKDRDGRYALIGARSLGVIRPHQARIPYYAGPSPPVEPGDPVLVGGALVGFVSEFSDRTRLPIALLNHAVPRKVLGAVRGVVADRDLYFVVGGSSKEIAGCIQVEVPPGRTDFIEGSRAYTVESSLVPGVPGGLVLGTVRLVRKLWERHPDIGIVPPYPPERLYRTAILVPAARLEGRDRIVVPEITLRSVWVRAFFDPGIRTGHPVLRVYAGLEKKIAPGDLLVSGGFALGVIEQAGLFASRGALLLYPGRTVQAAVFPRDGMPEYFLMEIVDREGLCFQVRAERELDRLEAGWPVYLATDPCTGLETFPVGTVIDAGSGRCFTLGIPWQGWVEACSCLGFRRIP